jgi:hypothetical protein
MTDTNKTEAPEREQQAQKALDKVMNERCTNFDKGAVIHWAEQGMYQVRADLSRPDPVTVKPLVWWRDPHNVSFVDAEFVDTSGLYCIAESVLFIGHAETGIPFDSVDEAKAAAQADYEHRILSALTPAPVTTAQAARVSALEKFMEATSKESGWGTYMWMDSPDMYTLIDEARALAEQEQE